MEINMLKQIFAKVK